MPTPHLQVEATRGEFPESVHRVSAAVVNAEGRLVASAGNPALVTWWRSAAKPFQVLPLVQDGAAARFGITDQELALACASHNSEPEHLDVVSGFMARIGVTDSDLACGPHPPLSPSVSRTVAREGRPLTPRWSNCSGKHTAMLALARHHGWPLQGYERAGHPVQVRILQEVARWTGIAAAEILLAPDGCTAVCFALPLQAMAQAYAALAVRPDPAARRIAGAMMAHPFLVAGTGRLCTDLMAAWPGRVIAKIGADGIYCAALPGERLGIALKIEDGDMRAAGVALLEILRQTMSRLGSAPAGLETAWNALTTQIRPPIRNSRDIVTGELRPAGGLRFYDG